MFPRIPSLALVIACSLAPVVTQAATYTGDVSSTFEGRTIKSPFLLRVKGNRVGGYVQANGVGIKLAVKGSITKAGKFHARLAGGKSGRGFLKGELTGPRVTATGQLQVPGFAGTKLALKSRAIEVAAPGFAGIYYLDTPYSPSNYGRATVRVYHTADAQGTNYMVDLSVTNPPRHHLPEYSITFRASESGGHDFLLTNADAPSLKIHRVDQADGTIFSSFVATTFHADGNLYLIKIAGYQWSN